MKCTTLIAATAALTLVNETFAAATLSADGKTLTLSAEAGETLSYAAALPATVETIVKTGAGRYDFAPSSISFAGTVRVEDGTLAGDRTAFGAPSKWIVVPGASLLFPTGAAAWSNPTGELEIGGAGVNGDDAFKTTASNNQHEMFRDGTKLTADTHVAGKGWGFGSLDMDGHDLYVKPTGGVFELFGYALSNPGDIHVLAGTAKFTEGGAKNPYPDMSGGAKYVVLSNGAKMAVQQQPAARPVTFGVKVPSGTGYLTAGDSTATTLTRDDSPITGPVDVAGSLAVQTGSHLTIPRYMVQCYTHSDCQ